MSKLSRDDEIRPFRVDNLDRCLVSVAVVRDLWYGSATTATPSACILFPRDRSQRNLNFVRCVLIESASRGTASLPTYKADWSDWPLPSPPAGDFRMPFHGRSLAT